MVSPKKNSIAFNKPALQSVKNIKKKKSIEADPILQSKHQPIIKRSRHFQDGSKKFTFDEEIKIPRREQIINFVAGIEEYEFENIPILKIKIVDFVFKNRIIKDAEFDQIYTGLVGRFNSKEDAVKDILVEIVGALDN